MQFSVLAVSQCSSVVCTPGHPLPLPPFLPSPPQDVQCLTERTAQHEVQLILLRFISILLGYRKKDKHKDAKVRGGLHCSL